jgi:DNA-binding beta-propeller fold protein YncE
MRSRSIEPLIAGAALGMFLYASSEALHVVDPATLRVIARAPVGPDPHEVIASSDGKTATSLY